MADNGAPLLAGVGIFAGIIGAGVLAALYLLPTIVAILRRSRYRVRIVAINLLLGWTLVGWVAALAMAFGEKRVRTGVPPVYPLGAVPPSSPVVLSPDRRFWWDGAAWRDTDLAVPPDAPRTEDGYYWWDGARWRSVPLRTFT